MKYNTYNGHNHYRVLAGGCVLCVFQLYVMLVRRKFSRLAVIDVSAFNRIVFPIAVLVCIFYEARRRHDNYHML